MSQGVPKIKAQRLGLFVSVKVVSLALTAAFLPGAVLAADIIGTSGPDVLEGTPDADKINGKGGADVMMGLSGDDTYIVTEPDDQVLEAVGDGTDRIATTVSFTLPINVDSLTLAGSATINGTGNGLNNRLAGNVADNTLNGRTGADFMFGLKGNDTYIVDSIGDHVRETSDEGTDAVRSTVTYRLPNNVENLVLKGDAAIDGTGNSFANSITGNADNNVLRGLDGDDRLKGGDGNDRLVGGMARNVLIGGPGRDEFQFDLPPNPFLHRAKIIDFSPIDDTIHLVLAAFPALNTAGTLPAAAFGTGRFATDPGVRIHYDPSTGNIWYDADGSGPTTARFFATLYGLPAVTHANFVVVNDPGEVGFRVRRRESPESFFGEGYRLAMGLRRVGGTTGEIGVSYRFVEGSAVKGPDFEGHSGTLTWADGEYADQYIYIHFINDGLKEERENFHVVLESLSGNVVIAPYSTLTVAILDDD